MTAPPCLTLLTADPMTAVSGHSAANLYVVIFIIMVALVKG